MYEGFPALGDKYVAMVGVAIPSPDQKQALVITTTSGLVFATDIVLLPYFQLVHRPRKTSWLESEVDLGENPAALVELLERQGVNVVLGVGIDEDLRSLSGVGLELWGEVVDDRGDQQNVILKGELGDVVISRDLLRMIENTTKEIDIPSTVNLLSQDRGSTETSWAAYVLGLLPALLGTSNAFLYRVLEPESSK